MKTVPPLKLIRVEKLSVVIPTMNRRQVLLETLEYLREQTFSDFELIVIDQSDTPNQEAESMLANFPVRARYYHVEEFRGLPQARNFGWRKARGQIVVYIDDDIECDSNFLQAHYDAHCRTDATMVAGGVTESKGDRTQPGGPGSFNWWTATPKRNFHMQRPGWCLHAPGGNFSIRRSALEQVGGFDENLSVGAALYEETELALRLRSAGFRCWFAPEAHVVHLAAPMGGCRVPRDVPRYVYGMGHNRSLLIFRHLRPWHRPSAILRMVLYGVTFSRAVNSLTPLLAALQGICAGRRAARDLRSKAGL